MPELHQLLERATTGLEPDIGSLVRGGRERGVRARARRRRGGAVAALVAAAALAVGAVYVPGMLDSDSGPEHTVALPATGSHQLPTPEQVSKLLGQLLPDGTAKPMRAWGKPGRFSAAAWSLDTPGAGSAGKVVVLVQPPPTAENMGKLADHPRAVVCDGEVVRCHDTSNGDSLWSWTKPVGGGDSGVLEAQVIRFTSDEFVIEAGAYNALKKAGPATGDKPVLDTDQLRDIVTDPGWLG